MENILQKLFLCMCFFILFCLLCYRTTTNIFYIMHIVFVMQLGSKSVSCVRTRENAIVFKVFPFFFLFCFGKYSLLLNCVLENKMKLCSNLTASLFVWMFATLWRTTSIAVILFFCLSHAQHSSRVENIREVRQLLAGRRHW